MTSESNQSSENKLALQVKALLWKKGQTALKQAKQAVQREKTSFEPLQTALEYFMSSWEDVAHPALIALACEAVGGNPEVTTPVGVAYVLLAGGADVHDDIIDQSTFKYSRQTVLGKFGRDIAILVGDALIFQGLCKLHEACEAFPKSQAQEVFRLTRQAFFGMSTAEAKESMLRQKSSAPSPKDYLDMIKTKAAAGEASMRIGAILGGGTPEEVAAMGDYGKTVAVLFTIRDEFIDIFDLDELRNRVEKECLPLPILFTLENPKKKNEIMQLLNQAQITEKELKHILDMVIDSEETRKLKKDMTSLVGEENQRLRLIRFHRKTLKTILRSMKEDL